jgi:hypothetical protein
MIFNSILELNWGPEAQDTLLEDSRTRGFNPTLIAFPQPQVAIAVWPSG